jgi:hypothetical protein
MTDIGCQYRDGQNCRVAQKLLRFPLTTCSDKICGYCLAEVRSRRRNRVTVSLAVLELRKMGRDDDATSLLARHARVFGRTPPAPSSSEQQNASMASAPSRWAKAVAKWTEAGRPNRTDEEVNAILEICTPCNKYRKAPWGMICSMCGCRVNKGEWAIVNKARMGTEHCPKHLW